MLTQTYLHSVRCCFIATTRHRRRSRLLARKAIALDRNARFRKLSAIADL